MNYIDKTSFDRGAYISTLVKAFINEGLGILPLAPNSKKPVSGYSSRTPVRDSNDAEVIFRHLPDTVNIGATLTGYLVVDVDVRSDADGFESLAALEEQIGTFPETLTVRTGGGGRHIYFRLPPNFEGRLRIKLNAFKRIEFKTSGYAVIPPSVHESGKLYAFESGYDLGTLCIADAPDALLALLAPPARNRKTTQGAALIGACSQAETGPGDSFMSAVVEGCRYVQEQIALEVMEEPHWYTLATLAAHAADGEQWYHAVSSKDPRYRVEETQAKLEHAREASGPRTCDYIAGDLSSDACRNCHFRHAITSPIQLGREHPGLLKILRDNVYDKQTASFVDVTSGRKQPAKNFNLTYAHVVKNPPMTVASSPLTLKVHSVDYVPGRERIISDDDGRWLYNSYQGGALEPKAGSHDRITAHFNYLFPDPQERDHVMDVLAHIVQKPSCKIKHMILLIGRQGTGKSWVGHLLAKLVGLTNFRAISSEVIKSRFHATLTNVQVLCIEELMNFEQLDASNKLKPFITEDWVRVEEKNVQHYDARSPRLVIAFSNHGEPIRIERSDRRYFVSQSDRPPQAPEYYDALFRALEEEAPAFMATLLARDLSSFSPDKAPPLTSAKQSIIQFSRPEIEQVLDELLDEGGVLFDADVFLRENLEEIFRNRLGRSVRQNEWSRATKYLGAEQLHQIRLEKDVRVRPWCHRNIEFWQNANKQELVAALKNITSSVASQNLCHSGVKFGIFPASSFAESDKGRVIAFSGINRPVTT